jgi:hypothetical protein
MFKFKEKSFKTRFTLYYIFKSTAWITPVFFLFLQDHIQLNVPEVLKISGTLMILPFILDIPLGLLADKLGSRVLLISGTVLQFFSLLGFFFLPPKFAYISYLISIIIAENCYSGAEQTYLSQNLGASENIKDFLKKINQYFYFLTIPALALGVVLFQINPYFPLYAQLISFFFAVTFILGQKDQKTNPIQGISIDFKLNTLIIDISNIFRSNEAVGLIIINAVFVAIVQISAKTIQGQIDLFSKGQTGFWLALSYVSSNIASGSSLLAWRNLRISHQLSVAKQILMCFVAFLAAQLLMINQNIFLISLGFIILNGFKSLFRPIISGELIHCMRHLPRMATKLSVVSTFTTIMVALFHICSGWLIEASNNAFFYFIALLMLIFGLGFLKLNTPQKFASFSGKKNLIEMRGGLKIFKQTYPAEAQLPDYSLIKMISAKWGIQVPKLIEQYNGSLFFEYIPHQRFKDLSRQEQLEFAIQLLNNQNKMSTEITGENIFSKVPINGSDFLIYLNEKGLNFSEILNQKYVSITHGDMNPNNILIREKEIILVDWDLVDRGYLWFDGLSLLTHPDLDFSIDQRVDLFQKLYKFSDLSWLMRMMAEFCRFKYENLVVCNSNELKIIAKKYRQLHLKFMECL